jgi:hypothetical protein
VETACSLDGVLAATLVQVSNFNTISIISHNVMLGMKIAKFEIKMILALFLLRYEYELVDASGKHPKQLPQPNWNDIHQVCQPLGYPHGQNTNRFNDTPGKTDGRSMLL